MPSQNPVGVFALCENEDGEAQTTLLSVDSLRKAAEEGYLSTSDNPLYLISLNDIIEVTTPPKTEDDVPRRTFMVVTIEGEAPVDFHEDALRVYSDLASSGFPEGSYVSAICCQPEPQVETVPHMMIHRDSVDGPWILGDRTSARRRQERKEKRARTLRDDATNPPWDSWHP